MRGVPNNPVPCTKCGDPFGYPSIGLCNRCKPPAQRKKYFWTASQDEQLRRIYAEHVGNKLQLGEALKSFAARLGWPTYIIKNRASQLRLCVDIRRSWRPEELHFLRTHAGSRPLVFFKEKLGRSYQSIRSMFDHLALSYRITEGYSRQDLAYVLGASIETVQKWIANKWLVPSPDTDRVPEDQVLRFLKNHPEQYRLKRVDEPWFKGMLFPLFGRQGLRRERKTA